MPAVSPALEIALCQFLQIIPCVHSYLNISKLPLFCYSHYDLALNSDAVGKQNLQKVGS